jgi:para-nitrobenzyl esterase
MSYSAVDRRDFLQRIYLAAISPLVIPAARIFRGRVQKWDPAFIIAETRFGKVRGINRRGINVFKGIPYGADTGGANRFMPPLDPAPWTGVRDALDYGHSAPQSVAPVTGKEQGNGQKTAGALAPSMHPGPSIFRALEVSGNKPAGEGEDCLALNVWTPAIRDGRRRPVMLWLHGGGFASGSGSNVGWDGTNLCLRGDVVVITVNHRLNVMGFADLSAFSPDFAASGNAGMLDIIQALKWVRDNITSFGGDPDSVMIFGQSGGGRKCETLLAMPAAKGLFHRAVIESGAAIRVTDQAIAIRNTEALLNNLGIPKGRVHDLQRRPLNEIMRAWFAIGAEMQRIDLHNPGFSPTVDGRLLPQHPFYPAASAVSADVPVIIGCTRTEWTGLTTDARLWQLDEKGMYGQVKKLLGDKAAEMISLYRKTDPAATPSEIFFLIASDYNYCAPIMKIAERRAALGRGPVYAYYFEWETPVQGGLLKSPHNLEWPFAFDNTELNANLTGGGPAAMALADKVSDAWIAFARTGDPNTPKLPHWPLFNQEDRTTLLIDNVSKVVNDPLGEKRVAMYEALRLGAGWNGKPR